MTYLAVCKCAGTRLPQSEICRCFQDTRTALGASLACSQRLVRFLVSFRTRLTGQGTGGQEILVLFRFSSPESLRGAFDQRAEFSSPSGKAERERDVRWPACELGGRGKRSVCERETQTRSSLKGKDRPASSSPFNVY